MADARAIQAAHEMNGEDAADQAVVEAEQVCAGLARELAATEETGRALLERMHPPTREEEIRTPVTVVGSWLGAGVGFGSREIEDVGRRRVVPEVDAEDVELAKHEYRQLRVTAKPLRKKLEDAKRALLAARVAAYQARARTVDAEARAGLGEIRDDLARVSEKMQRFIDETVPELNRRVGRDPSMPEHAPPRYHAPALVFAPLYCADPRSGSLLDGWLVSLGRGGWLA